MSEAWQIAGLLLLSSVKFFLSPPAAVLAGYGFLPSIFITCTGGVVGFLIFFSFGKRLRKFYFSLFKRKLRLKFNKRNRRIIKAKNSYGLWGLALLTPCLFGIPLGGILAAAFYGKQKRALVVFLSSIISWSVLLTAITLYFKS